MKKRDLPLVVHNHHDLTWRRCFDRDLEFRGESYVPYSHLQALYILKNLDNCEKHPEYKFTIECVAVLKRFLSDHPDKKDIIYDHLKSGRINIPLTGHNIVDSNLIQGESIIRNYLFGHDYLKENFDYKAEGFDRNDSFGNSAQLPQIARGFGADWVYNVVYTNIEGNYWRGLDGSTLAKVDPMIAGISGGYPKYRPCPACKGKDKTCSVCNGDRIDKEYVEERRAQISIDPEPQFEDLQGMVYVSAEELLPSDSIFDWIEENKDNYNLYFSNVKEMAHRYFAERISKADNPPEDEVHPAPEVNFNNTGVYASRIKTKQNVRSFESRIYSLESAFTALSVLGKPYPFEKLYSVWDKLLFSMFHDAVTGTMVDQAYDELMGIHSEIDRELSILESEIFGAEKDGDTISIVNPTARRISGFVTVELEKGMTLFDENGERLVIAKCVEGSEKNTLTFSIPSIEPFSVIKCKKADCKEAFEKEYHRFAWGDNSQIAAVLRNDVEGPGEGSRKRQNFFIENEFYRIDADNFGICKITDKLSGESVFEESEHKIGEWILEHDEGSPWTTLSEDTRRMPMSEVTRLVAYEKTADAVKLSYWINKRYWGYAVDSGHDIRYTVSLVKGVKKVLFEADILWDTQNHRLRVAFPTPVKGAHIYEIPYGYLERKPYKANCVWPHGPSNWAGANGDMPAINWAGIEGDEGSVALLNKGTPCYRIEDDKNGNKEILLTVLRSPSVGTYLHEPLSYSMTDYDRMRDPGNHHFEYALTSYSEGFDENSAIDDGNGYNAKLYAAFGDVSLPEMPLCESDGVKCSSVKRSSDKEGIIYRLWETTGKGASVTLSVPSYVKKVYETDLKEDILRELSVSDSKIELELEPFKLKTLKFEI